MKQKTTLNDVMDVRSAGCVIIHDSWIGYNEAGPMSACYHLLRGPRGNLKGKGWFSMGDEERALDVTVPASATKLLFEEIATAPIRPGAYRPLEMWTDDYPRIEIALHAGPFRWGGGGIALLFTESQGEFHAPWGACIDGRLWTLPDETIGRALTKLRGPLKRATLGGLLRPARSAPRVTQKAHRVAKRIR